MNKPRMWVAMAAAVGVLAGTADASINPYFNLVHLVKQADAILVISARAGDKPTTLLCRTDKVLKGKPADWKAPTSIDLAAAAHEAHGEFVAKLVADHPNAFGMLFVGKFKEEKEEDEYTLEMADAYLRVGDRWVSLYKARAGGYEMDRIDKYMILTWGGGTDMIQRAVEYILADPKASLPLNAAAAWAGQTKIATIAGRVASAVAVDLAGRPAQALLLACDRGDRLFVWDGQTLADVTAARRLTSRSAFAAWGDFDHDGRLDLAGSDGKAIHFHLQQGDGTFKPVPADAGEVAKAGVLGLAVVDAGRDGRAGLLVSTAGWPTLLALDAGGKCRSTPLGAGELPVGKEFGRPGASLVADLDGDCRPDVLGLFAGGSLLYRGRAAGRFDKPAACTVALGPGRSKAFLGDWDGDGLLDVLCVAEDRRRLWRNLGGRFDERHDCSGAIRYFDPLGATDGQTTDLDNDGRQDMLLVFGRDRAPRLFYNAGFRWMEVAYGVDLETHGFLKEAEKGCQAGCMGDFNGDGRQDMCLVLRNGQVWLFRGKTESEMRTGRPGPATQPGTGENLVRVALPPGGRFAGPVTVTGYIEHRCLGAWNVTAAHGAWLARPDPGPITLKWRFPGGRPRQVRLNLAGAPITHRLQP